MTSPSISAAASTSSDGASVPARIAAGVTSLWRRELPVKSITRSDSLPGASPGAAADHLRVERPALGRAHDRDARHLGHVEALGEESAGGRRARGVGRALVDGRGQVLGVRHRDGDEDCAPIAGQLEERLDDLAHGAGGAEDLGELAWWRSPARVCTWSRSTATRAGCGRAGPAFRSGRGHAHRRSDRGARYVAAGAWWASPNHHQAERIRRSRPNGGRAGSGRWRAPTSACPARWAAFSMPGSITHRPELLCRPEARASYRWRTRDLPVPGVPGTLQPPGGRCLTYFPAVLIRHHRSLACGAAPGPAPRTGPRSAPSACRSARTACRCPRRRGAKTEGW